MKTKERIKASALTLFNQQGLINVTLREVAEKMDKSYGNITYHFPTKFDLIEDLYVDMQLEFQEIAKKVNHSDSILHTLLLLPSYTYDLSIKYLFFYVDYIEIKRHYASFMKQVDKDNSQRAVFYRGLLQKLLEQGFFEKHIGGDSLDYMIQLSGAIRTFYFIQYNEVERNKDSYMLFVNRMLYAYLSIKGRDVAKKYGVIA